MDFETKSDSWGDTNYVLRNVDSVSFFAGGVALRKTKSRDTAAALEHAEQYMSQIAPTADHLHRFAQFLLRHNGPLERAEQAARDAAGMNPGDFHPMITLSDILNRQGRIEDAAAAARTAAELRPEDAGLWSFVALLERRLRRGPEAIEALTKATSLRPENWNFHRDLSEVLEAQGDLRGALAAAQQGAERGAGQPGVEALQRRLESLRGRLANVA